MQQLPDPFITEIRSLLGTEAPAFFEAVNEEPVTAVRFNARKKSEPSFTGNAVPWCPGAIFLGQRPQFIFDPLFHAGAYYVQEASSMFLYQALKQLLPLIPAPVKALDLCAAPGGKSTLISSCLSADDLLVSNEIIRSRVNVLQENMMRWGAANTVVTNNDPKQFGSLPAFFDLVVLDAPCSGEGMFRKDKKAIGEWSPEHVALCSARQQRIIDDVWPSLKPGGFLIYSTCTFNTSENEQNVLRMIKEYGARTIPVNINEEWGITEISTFEGGQLNAYRFYPHKTKGEGFFICCLQKPAEAEIPGKPKHPVKLSFVSRATRAITDPWLRSPENFSLLADKEEIVAIPATHENDIAQLKASLHVVSAGTKMGTIIRDQLIPDHALALSNELSASVQQTELSSGDALLFLKKGSLPAGLFPRTGWFLVTCQGLGLGWVKAMPGRVNNYLPVNLRILKDLQS